MSGRGHLQFQSDKRDRKTGELYRWTHGAVTTDEALASAARLAQLPEFATITIWLVPAGAGSESGWIRLWPRA